MHKRTPSTNDDCSQSPQPKIFAGKNTVAFTIFENHGRLSKEFNLRNDGSLSVSDGTHMSSGEYSVKQFDASDPAEALTDIGRLFESLPPYAAAGLGVTKNGSTEGKICTKERYAKGN